MHPLALIIVLCCLEDQPCQPTMPNFYQLVAMIVSSVLSIVLLIAPFASTCSSAFQPPPTTATAYPHSQSFHDYHLSLKESNCLSLSRSDEQNGQEKKKSSFWDVVDDVVDDFVMKRMGAGEQWYGKRKNNPSGKFDGKYEGGGRSDAFQIEIAKIQREEMELKKQRRLAAAAAAAEEEERARRNKKL